MKNIKYKEPVFADSIEGKVRPENEDNYGYLNTPNGFLCVVCDGMGGHAAGDKASKIAVDSIKEFFKHAKYPNTGQAFNDSLQFANQKILDYASEHPETKGMGTTACLLLVQDQQVRIAHVGDSRIYLYLGKERKLHRITKDHSLVQYLVDLGEITDAEAEHHPQKNKILKALGIKQELLPEIARPIHPKRGDVFLICSDGLSGMMDDSGMESILNQDISLYEKGDKLIQLAMDNGGLDNITLQLIEITQSPYKERKFVSKNPAERQVDTLTDSGSSLKFNMRKIIVAIIAAAVIIITGVYFLIHNQNNTERRMQQNEIYRMIQNTDSIAQTIGAENMKKLIEKKSEIMKKIANQKIDNKIYQSITAINNVSELKDSTFLNQVDMILKNEKIDNKTDSINNYLLNNKQIQCE